MMRFTQGNLLQAETEAIVNTVNTVGVMGKGIALAFKEAFPENFRLYATACAANEVQVGRIFVTENTGLGPRWIVNFPTKKHWRHPSKIEWVRDGLSDLRRFIVENGVRSIAIPPLGCGQGGLDWNDVRPLIEQSLANLDGVDVVAYEPTATYHTPLKREGAAKLTPARALIAEAVRRYSVLGIECSYLEVQKLAYFIERSVQMLGLKDPLRMQFQADRYGPYSDRLRHLLDALDGTWLFSDKRLADAGPMDRIRFADARHAELAEYLASEIAAPYEPALEKLSNIIDGFESPLGMELLATVDWLLTREHAAANPTEIRRALDKWPAGTSAAQRKQKLFDDRMLRLALDRLDVPARPCTS